MADNVNHPSHYCQGGIECIDAIEAATVHKTGIEAVCVANAIKYLWRFESKNGLEDVRKSLWYVNKLVSILETKEKTPEEKFEEATNNYMEFFNDLDRLAKTYENKLDTTPDTNTTNKE